MHTIQLLLNEGADIQTSDDDGVSALHHSSSVGYMDTVKPLLDQGADIQAADKKTRRCINSACAGHMLLLDRYHWANALHCSVVERRKATVELLLSRGADIQTTDKAGRTALHNLEEEQKRTA